MVSQVDRFLKTYSKSEVVFHQNVPGREMYIVSSGRVDILLEGAQGGKTTLLATIGAGEFFGEMALVDGGPRSASAVAAEDKTRLIVLDRARLVELFREKPEIGLSIIQTLCRRIRAMNEALAQVRV